MSNKSKLPADEGFASAYDDGRKADRRESVLATSSSRCRFF